MASENRRRRSRRRHRNRRIIWWTVGSLALLLVAVVAWIGVRGFLAYNEIQTARSGVDGVQAQLLSDPEAASVTIDELGAHTKRAAALTSDPVWRAAEVVPWLGPNLEAFRTTAWSLDKVVRSVAAPLVSHVSGLQASLSPVDGRIDTAPLVALQPASEQANDWMQEVEAAMRGINRSQLFGPLADAVGEFNELLTPIAQGVGAVHSATVLMPAILGADGQRDTLLLFLNNAEVRSTVGIPGALALVSATDGRISLAAQASTRDFPTLETPIADLGPEIRGVYSDRPALWIQNVTMLPEFEMSGELAASMWAQQFGVAPGAVVALDPFTLSYVLEATGPIELATGESLTSDNATELLLHEVYLRYERPIDQDAFFADASERVFDAVAGGRFDPTKLIGALARAVDENRIKMWSSVPEEQALLTQTALGGALPSANARDAMFTMHLNDGTGAKMDYYLASSLDLEADMCPVDEARQTVTVRYALENTAPADAGTSLPWYITGGGQYYGITPGDISTVAYLYAPPGFELLDKNVDGDVENAGVSALLFDRSLVTWHPLLTPGQSSTIELVYAAEDHRGAKVLWQQTPTFYHTVTETIGNRC